MPKLTLGRFSGSYSDFTVGSGREVAEGARSPYQAGFLSPHFGGSASAAGFRDRLRGVPAGKKKPRQDEHLTGAERVWA